MSAPPLPGLWIENCQEDRPVDLSRLEAVAGPALREVWSRTGAMAAPGAMPMEELEVSLVGEEEICRLHEEFLNDSSPTDVITFEHGELIIGVEAAVIEAAARNWPLERELLLYVIHGLLHLRGWNDEEPGEAERMRRLQEEILDSVWPHGEG